ncbi:MAG TPA: archaetidylserine decarboxylase [Rhodanobacteraceae bacterium]|nr:archaetidylserine decarboxylase [Rhodanobacteraceae bacterium]
MTLQLLLQYLLPHRTLSKLVRRATRWTWRPWKNWLIGRIVRAYAVDMSEAAEADPFSYPQFNAFFTRALKAGARPADPAPAAILSPADGRISQAGIIRDGRILQAKGQDFSVAEFLADASAAERYRNGRFVTVYLSPRDYHRAHMPLDGQLQETVHVPGRLFSVAPFAVAGVPRLFARNERLLCHFDGPRGPFVVAMVGAMLVSGVETVWSGEVIPPYADRIARQDWRAQAVTLARHAEMARFNMGSTVIVLLPSGAELDPDLAPEQPVRMGQRLGVWA